VSGAALAAERLTKRFGALTVADGITFELPVGARHALIGPNGAGKTTLVNLLTGALAPSGGRIRLGGEDVTALSPSRRVKRGLARTFQINQLFPDLTAIESVALAVCERRGLAGNWRRRLPACGEALDEGFALLRTVGLAAECHRRTGELAYGRQRLLEIALALATGPKVLLLDEPAAGVPKAESAAIFEAIAALRSEIAVLFIEHDMHLVFRFATRILVMAGGRLIAEGPPDAISRDERVRQVYLGRRTHAA
jgi:ABC-type branched-subunit amino acid transport system ATPase component